ncbi:L-2,4-diaminobutyrate decarboxylase [Methylobacillus rhizosphaerae]|uniref:L-2,4-diaminobutyrate decarboxylase n=1 Tax=Methylobacillus rhizosphaerae TaxID=551994 RepID=A0A239AM23_9PROT|nr:aminotransferase class V-fold PLP-dependent enzyme [Methylobacillus rhizosphaerae]SNR96560.1 L-2,4-diaminobutyrate decarboxylase [Methylobacillus rhizosphaerae]
MTSSELYQMFDSEQFRSSGHALIDLLAAQLTHELSGKAELIHWQPPVEAAQSWQQPMPEVAELSHSDFITWLQEEILPRNLAMHHPHSMAHQAAPPLPMAALCDLVAALCNQAMALYETGPAATLLEHQAIHWLTTAVGWSHGTGVLTSGGSQANLTALLAARQHAAANIWQEGVTAAPPLRILASELAHYSVKRTAAIMGLGADALISIATDQQGRISLEALKEAHTACQHRHEPVMAIVATAGCTATGSIDPLQAIGQYCQAHGVWLHIDGAHGAAAVLSNQHADKLQGIHLADSVSWDGHKLLYMPATVSAVLFRNTADSYLSFAQEASYLFNDEHGEETDFNLSYRTLECTKRMMALKIVAAFKLYGRKGMASLLDHVFALAEQFAVMLSSTPGFELLMHPQTNIVCFRYHGNVSNTAVLDSLQVHIRQQLLHRGLFHLSQVEINNSIWLRSVFMNPQTQPAHQQHLLQEIIAIARARA